VVETVQDAAVSKATDAVEKVTETGNTPEMEATQTPEAKVAPAMEKEEQVKENAEEKARKEAGTLSPADIEKINGKLEKANISIAKNKAKLAKLLKKQ